MIIEFDLDAPDKPKPTRLRFRNETRCVTALYERCYESSDDTGQAWKILVEVVGTITKPTIRNLIGVMTIQISGDVEAFFSLHTRARTERALDYLMDGIEKVIEEKGWNVSSFYQARDQVRYRRYVNEWIWKSPIPNKSKKFTAEVLVEHEVTQARISVRFRDNDQAVVGVKHLVSDEPNEFIFDAYLGQLRWLNESTVELISRDGTKRFSAQITGSSSDGS